MATTCGALLLIASAAAPGALPVLSNYVPAIDHPLFVAALAGLGVGFALVLLDGRLEGDGGPAAALPDCAVPALRGAGVALLLALVTFFASAVTTPPMLPQRRFELFAWGGFVLDGRMGGVTEADRDSRQIVQICQ